MKIFKTVLMIALCGGLMTEASFAGDPIPGDQTEGNQAAQKIPFQVGMYRIQKSLTMNVLVEKKLGDRVEVQLVDEKGHVLFEDVMGKREQKSGFKLNFSEIQDGKYSVVVTNGAQVITKEINLSTLNLYEMPARTLVAGN
ncbi:hypothetical protein [Salmonirosea aquatica]|uniref:Secretion system C-terminal sorting domain-containing protein n=1 Tax=Salmonirosea aquatica TaxID=2654236 RepID=A0A7C9FF03_9BACT|nr:hypothetical protein [Cytophagaceae bacterium SJW1-29]